MIPLVKVEVSTKIPSRLLGRDLSAILVCGILGTKLSELSGMLLSALSK